MARGGSKKYREQKVRPPNRERREDTLVGEIWAYHRALRVRNKIIARFQDQLTAEERADLSEFVVGDWDYDQAERDLDEFKKAA